MADKAASVEFLDCDPVLGSADDVARSSKPARRQWVVGLGGVAAAVALIAAGMSGASPRRATPAPPTTLPISATPAPDSAVTATVQRLPVVVDRLHAAVLGTRTGEDVFARGPGFVARIELARGVVTRTLLPGLATGGPVSFIPLRADVLVRPLDRVLGYEVPDRHAARVPHGELTLAGPAWPAPNADTVWVDVGERIVLVGPRGRRLGRTLPVPPGAAAIAGWADGRGNLLFETVSGWFDVRADRTVQVTAGNLVAVGPSRYLVSECRTGICSEVLVDRTTGRRARLGPALDLVGVPGVISPDGSAAARVDPRTSCLVLTDLPTGRDHTLPIQPAADPQSLAWDPDGPWLFVADRTGRLEAVDSRTLGVVDLTRLAGGPVTQVAVRPAANG